ncbi:MAG: AAA family ATPase [Acidobacteria bacterium]|nr:AAA family ATPase [Acidobacteriota bacterium]
MYERFFGFRERPFDLTPNPKYLVLTDPHREVLSNLEYAIASRKGVTVVLGEPGSGKTTLIRAVLQAQPERVHHVHLSNPTLSREEFSQLLALKFGLSDAASASKAIMLAELERLLSARRGENEVTVLIVDEAQSAPDHVLEEIRLLANIEADDQKLVSVILAGQPELASRLDRPNLRQLKQRVALRCQLRSLTLQETSEYVAGRITAAGGVGGEVFTREAVALMHEAAEGLPRAVNVLADNALLGGFAAGQKPVTTRIVREVCRDFGVGRAASPAAAENGAAPASPAPRVFAGPVTNGPEPASSAADDPDAETDSPTAAGWFSGWSGRRHTRLFR